MTDARKLESGVGREEEPGHTSPERLEKGAELPAFPPKLGIQTQWDFAHLLKVPQSTVNRQRASRWTKRGVVAPVSPSSGSSPSRASSSAETAEQPNRAFLRATLRNRTGIAARVLTVLTVLAAHGCDIVRVAGFQDGQCPGTSIFRVIVVLPEAKSLHDVDTDLTALEDALATEYPVRPLYKEVTL